MTKPRSTADALEQLRVMVAARYPIVWVVSHEERRVVDVIAEWGAQSVYGLSNNPLLPNGRQIWVWSHTKGWQPKGNQRNDVYTSEGGTRYEMETEGSDDFLIALEGAARYGLADYTDRGVEHNASLFIFLDPHPFFEDGIEDGPRYRRAVRDLYGALDNTRSTAIFVSSTLPPTFGGAEKEISVLDWPLPDRSELESLVRNLPLPDTVPQDLNGETQTLIDLLGGLTWKEAEQALLKSVVEAKQYSADTAIPIVLDAKRTMFDKVTGMEYFDDPVPLDQIGGVDLLAQFAGDIPRKLTPDAKAFGVVADNSVLLVGPPGTGKSLTAKVIATAGKMPLIRMDLGAIKGQYVGQTDRQLREALKTVEAVRRCVLWLDEVEKVLGGGSGDGDSTTSSTIRQEILAYLLTWMQEELPSLDVIVVATVNEVRGLRPEFINRFRRLFFVDLPSKAGCQQILDIHLSKRNRSLAKATMETLASIAFKKRLNGREIERAVEDAIWHEFTASKGKGSKKALADGVDNALALAVPISTTMRSTIDAMRDWCKTRALPTSSDQQPGSTLVEPKDVPRRLGV